MHAVLPHMTGNYMPLKYDFGINVSKFTYGPKQSTTSESDAKTSDLDSYDSSSSEETLKTVPKPVKSQPKVVNEPKVWSDAHIIKDTARKVNTARPKVNEIRPRHNVYKSHSPMRRPFNKTTAPKANFGQHKVNTAWDKLVSAVGGKWETVVKASA
nr:hypothetical protein [Tanacetum cinerariifolium]